METLSPEACLNAFHLVVMRLYEALDVAWEAFCSPCWTTLRVAHCWFNCLQMNETRTIVDVNNVWAKCKLKFTLCKHYILYMFNYEAYVVWGARYVKLKYYKRKHNKKSTDAVMQHERQHILLVVVWMVLLLSGERKQMTSTFWDHFTPIAHL